MTTKIQIFKNEMFGEVRTMTNEKGETFFVGKDVAKALGYSNTRDALSRHVDAEDKGTVAFHDPAYETRAIIINESGLYALVLSSKLPKAKKFKDKEPREQFRKSTKQQYLFINNEATPFGVASVMMGG